MRELAWLESLSERSVVGIESRLLTLFELVRQMSIGRQRAASLFTNEINFLAFPPVKETMVIFGAGYGFAILNQLREYLPHAESFLMDRETLLAHRPLWGEEKHPETATLTRLTAEEQAIYNDLRDNKPGNNVRLEQEKIGFRTLLDALNRLSLSPAAQAGSPENR